MQEEQAPIDSAIINAIEVSIPESWNSALLVIERLSSDSPVGDLQHSIESPEGYAPVAPDMSLFDATYNLDALFHRYGAILKKAVYRVDLEDGSYRWKAHFEKY